MNAKPVYKCVCKNEIPPMTGWKTVSENKEYHPPPTVYCLKSNSARAITTPTSEIKQSMTKQNQKIENTYTKKPVPEQPVNKSDNPKPLQVILSEPNNI